MTHLASSLVVGSALLAAASLGTPMAAAASHRAITQAPTQQVNAAYAQYRRYGYARPRARYYRRGYNRGGALAAGAALGFLAVPPRLPPLQGITAAPMAASRPGYGGYAAPGYGGYAAPGYGGYAAPGYGGYAAPGYGGPGCDPYYGC